MAWTATYTYILGFLAAFGTWLYLNSESHKLRHIPTIGNSSPLLSYISAFKYMFRVTDMVNEGIHRYKGRPFKIPIPERWMVIVHGNDYVKELLGASEDKLSLVMAVNETLQAYHTMGSEILENPYHVTVVRNHLTKNLGKIFPELHEEILDACNELIPPTEDWKPFHAFDTFLQIICRSSNRTFVGLPLCRNLKYLEVCKAYSLDVLKASSLMNMLPPFLRPLSAYMLRGAYHNTRDILQYLEPILSQYKGMMTAGDEMPTNLLTWLLQEAKGVELSSERLARRILTLNFASIHTTTLTFLHVLYNLASYPEYVQELRKEVEDVIAAEGWNKAALGKMRKIDSFLKETQRFEGLGTLASSRLAVKGYTFHDGTVLPKGAVVSIAPDPAHFNESVYSNPEKFDGYRFLQSDDDDKSGYNSMVTLSTEYLAFGFGKHACPGRFFAANELKLIVAHIITTYDVKHIGNKRPENGAFVHGRFPNMKAEVMFRKRST